VNERQTLRRADDVRLNVRIDSGTVRGAAQRELVTFMGIPFAQPPVGALRWRAPQPVKPWQGVRDASVVGRELMQLAAPGTLDAEGASENCLYLNVWRPAEPPDDALPVMVWIHGGDVVRRLGSCCLMDRFARQGRMVVVSVSYRENRFGFFAHPALADEAPDELRGDYAYMDQIAALEWVQRNIASFGGDRDSVTIAGESAGAGSVLALMISPMARGLFHRGILESPVLPSPRDAAVSFRALDSAESRAIEYARDAGIAENGDPLAELRALPARDVLSPGAEFAAAVLEAAGGAQVRGFSGPMIDGRLIPERLRLRCAAAGRRWCRSSAARTTGTLRQAWQ
jgi:para-nitrobenzyl esterase